MLEREGKKLEFLAGKQFWNYAGINIYTDVLYEIFNYLFRKWLDFHMYGIVCVCLCVCVWMYVVIHSCDKSSNDLFICWNAGQLEIVGFD